MKSSNDRPVQKGNLLISEPFLYDQNFNRSLILICEDKKGHLGFILNRVMDLEIEEVTGLQPPDNFPLYMGGPVAQNTLHFIHRRPDIIPDSEEVAPGIFWGGRFETVESMIEDGLITNKDIRFFIGYSGWSEGQLDEEIENKSWFVSTINETELFEDPTDNLWKKIMNRMGGQFRLLANSPEDPQLN